MLTFANLYILWLDIFGAFVECDFYIRRCADLFPIFETCEGDRQASHQLRF